MSKLQAVPRVAPGPAGEKASPVRPRSPGLKSRLIDGLLPIATGDWLRRVAQAARQRLYRARRILDLDTRSREHACREEFFYNAFKALTFNQISGDYCEFGSFGAVTFRFAYQQSRRHRHPCTLWSFDSFAGFPIVVYAEDDHPKWRQGGMSMGLQDFKRRCALSRIPETDYRIVPGFYEDSLPRIGPSDGPTDICLAYIDCDMYASTKVVLEFLRPRLKHGMILAFDDYYCWSATRASGERQAMREVFHDGSPWELVPYLTFGWAGASFVVESRESAPR